MSTPTLEHEPGPVERALAAPPAPRVARGDVVRDPGAAPSRRSTAGSRPAPSSPAGPHGPRAPRSGSRTAAVTGATATPRVRLVPALTPEQVPAVGTPPHVVPPTVGARIEALRASDRSTVVEASDEPRGPVPSGDLYDTSRALAHAVLEVLAGTRPIAQLARWVTPGVYEALRSRTSLTVRVLGAATARRPLVRRVRVCPVDPHVAEATVVAHDGRRVRAVALRLETHRGAWRVTALEVG